MAAPNQITRQERILADAQRHLDRIEKMHEAMKKQVEAEMRKLEELQGVSSGYVNMGEIVPPQSLSSPADFKSQFDQFGSTLSNQRLTTELQKPISTQALPTASNANPWYNSGNHGQSWQELNQDPGKPVHVSIEYTNSKSGTPINAKHTYEYQLSPSALPLKVGDRMEVPVHHNYHPWNKRMGSGKMWEGELIGVVTSIHENPNFAGHPEDIARKKLL